MAIGIICEYSPFHNGHLYHVNEIKKMYPDEEIFLVMSSHFLQRGEPRLIDKWKKTEIALDYGIDGVFELPFVFSSQGADLCARGSIEILKDLRVNKLVFGSESNDIEKLKKIASVQSEEKFHELVRKRLDDGNNYPNAVSFAIDTLLGHTVNTPNDILGVTYIKEIINQNANIDPITIKRTNDFHGVELNNRITSATSIREGLKNGENVNAFVPKKTYDKLNDVHFIEDYFELIRYKIITNIDKLNMFQTVDEGIEYRLKKFIYDVDSIDELINKVITKRYTKNKVRRMLVHILCDFTKEEASNLKSDYIRVPGFNKKGQAYLNSIKRETNLPIITGFSNIDSPILNIELRVSSVYYLKSKVESKSDLLKSEYKNRPIIK